jgi:hypothetical protein
MHRGGGVVAFEEGGGWVGNFQAGLGGATELAEHPNRRDVVVVAAGQAYQVEPATRRLVGTFGGQIQFTLALPDLQLFVTGNGLWFDAIGRAGPVWRTRRLSWDDMRDVRVLEGRIVGLGWDLQTWVPFEVDLLEGTAVGGGYTGPDCPGIQYR